MPRTQGALYANERRRLYRAGFTVEEIHKFHYARHKDSSGTEVLTPIPFYEEGRLDNSVWREAMKSHRVIKNVFFDTYLDAHPDAPESEIRMAYRAFINGWRRSAERVEDPWIWIDKVYQRGIGGSVKRRENAQIAINQLEQRVRYYFD